MAFKVLDGDGNALNKGSRVRGSGGSAEHDDLVVLADASGNPLLNGAAIPTVADGFAKTVVGTTLTRQANTTAYAAGRLIGGSGTTGFDGGGGSAVNGMTFTGIARTAGGVVRIDRARLYSSNAALVGVLELRLYRAKPTITIADTGDIAAGAPVGSANSAARLVGRIQFDKSLGVAGSDGMEIAAAPLYGPIITTLPSGASDLFGLLVTAVGGAGYTPVSGETLSVVLEGYGF